MTFTLPDLNAIPFLQARSYHQGGNGPVTRVVLHDMEAAETDTTAENVARNFATSTREASAHYCVDNNSVVGCVHLADIAYHAPPNTGSIGIEHAGYAAQRREQWLDEYSHAELVISAALTRALCLKYNLPMEYVDAAGLLAGKKGITTHWQVSLAWHKTDHTDPGPNFPMDYYIALVKAGDGAKPEPKGNVVIVNAPQVTILSHPSWNGGYVQIHADGGVVNHGEAPFYGSMGGTKLNSPVVDADVTPSGKGYTMLGADGGIFNFGDAVFEGSHGPEAENSPFVSITLSATGLGYWLGGRDGSVWGYGDAKYIGSSDFKG